jgi:hypothetical protein
MIILPFFPLLLGLGACFSPKPSAPLTGSFDLVYQSSVGGEIEPCG